MEAQTSIKNIYQRINAVMQEVDYVQKGSKMVNNQYKFVSHDAVSATLHGPMTKHGIACIPSILEMKQDGNRTEVKLEVAFINIDNPQDRFTVIYYGMGVDQSDKGIGKAVSYAFKYSLLKVFTLETGDDADNDADSKYEPPKPVVPQMTYEEIEAYIDTFDPYSPDFRKYINFVKDSKKDRTYEEAASLCRKSGDKTIEAFHKWREKEMEKKK